jgi:hypothetical protein
MKKTVFILILFLSYVNFCSSQEFPSLKHIRLSKNAHYKSAEPTVLKLIDYIFETPINKKNLNRQNAGQFLVKWMNGTPDYTFYLEEQEIQYFDNDSDLFLVYMAGLTKYTLLNKEIKDKHQLNLGALNLILPYLEQQEDKKLWSIKLWQLNDAFKQGKLQTFLNQ